MRNRLCIFLLLLLPVLLLAQERTPFKGRVIYGSLPMKDMLMVNLSSQREIKTDTHGDFTLMAKPGDTLIAALPKPKRIVLAEADFKTLFLIDVGAYELEEVVITKYANINSVALGLVPANQKRYSVAERRLRVANGDGVELHNTMTGGFVSLDGFLNALSGRTGAMKRALESERKEEAVESASSLYDEQTIASRFKIPKEYVKGFLFYIVEDIAFARAAREHNETLMQFLMSGLAEKYIELIKDEK